MKTLIVGGGIVGLSTAWALAAAGQEVTLVEQGELPNALAASNDQHRLIRYPYAEAAGYCRMVDDAYAAWDKLWQALGETHYVETGTIALSCYADDWSDRSRRSLDQTGIAYDLLSPEAVAQRYPFFIADGIRWGLYVKRGGVLLAERIVTGLTRYLARQGVDLRPFSPVTQLDVEARQVTLASGEHLQGDRLVFATGAWSAKLLPRYAARVTPLRQVVAYIEPPAELASAWAQAPSILDTGGDEEGYVVPPVAGTQLKFAAGAYNRAGDPDDPRQTSCAEGEHVLAFFRRRFANIEGYRCLGTRVCYYGQSADQKFIVEAIADQVWAVTGCSGHGFKFGAAIGVRLAETLIEQRPASELTAWAAGMESERNDGELSGARF